MCSRLKKLLRDDEAQTLTEYAIVVFFMILATIPLSATLLDALTNYHYDITSLVCLPVP